MTSLPSLSLFSKYHTAGGIVIHKCNPCFLFSIVIIISILFYFNASATCEGWWKTKQNVDALVVLRCPNGTIEESCFNHQLFKEILSKWNCCFTDFARSRPTARICKCGTKTSAKGMAADAPATSEGKDPVQRQGKRFFIPCTMSQYLGMHNVSFYLKASWGRGGKGMINTQRF